MIQRASHANNLNSMQTQFLSALPSTMIDTFNIGYKFANAASLVIQMDTNGISQNAANEYNVDTNTNITLDASSILSSINLKNPDLTFQ
ncbi:hypothetical protein J6W20_03765 [bacterium]|nr:hypothetical protein [bacterium]